MKLTVTGEAFEWRGPAPYVFVRVPDDHAGAIALIAGMVSYGWGMIPVTGRVGRTEFTTALWPKDGTYVIPLKVAVQRAEQIELGDEVTVELTIDLGA